MMMNKTAKTAGNERIHEKMRQYRIVQDHENSAFLGSFECFMDEDHIPNSWHISENPETRDIFAHETGICHDSLAPGLRRCI